MVNPFLNRREFISATTAAGAGLLLNGCKSDSGQQGVAAHKSSLNTLNIALIGYGEEGKVLLESLLNIEGIKLVALCDIWDYHLNEGARYLQKLGNEVRTYENYEDLLSKEKDLQAVLIATPDFWHAPDDQHMPESRSACVLRKDDEQHDRWSAVHGNDHARNRKAAPDRSSAAQQSALPFHPEPPAP